MSISRKNMVCKVITYTEVNVAQLRLSVPFHFYKNKKAYVLLILGKYTFKTMTEISAHLLNYMV